MKIHIAVSELVDLKLLPSGSMDHYKDEVKRSFDEVSKLLPFGSKKINFFVQPRTYNLIKETNVNAHCYNSELIELAFDPTQDTKSLDTIFKDIRPSVYHEMNHAARYHLGIFHQTFLDSCVMEGLATVFERDYAENRPPYGKYPNEVMNWIDEIIKLNDYFSWPNYSFDHPDGRRWIAYKVGTYIVDQAIEKSGKTVIELTQLPSKEIIALAGIDISDYTGLG